MTRETQQTRINTAQLAIKLALEALTSVPACSTHTSDLLRTYQNLVQTRRAIMDEAEKGS